MKKIPLLFFLCIFLVQLIVAQQVTLLHSIKYSDFTFSSVMTSDKDGNIFMSGHYRGTNNSGNKGIFIHKYSATDALIWNDTTNTDANLNDITGLAADQYGNAYFARPGNVSFGNGVYVGSHLIKYDPTGQIQWVINSLPCFNVATDLSNGVYVSSNNISKFSNTGNCLSTIGISSGGSVTIDAHNNYYIVTGSSLDKHDSGGKLLWSHQAMTDSRIALDNAGNCYLSETGNLFSSPLSKIDSSGKILWSIDLPFYGAYALCCNSDNEIYITGLYGVVQTIDGVEMRKIDGNGKTLWTYRLPESSRIRPTGLLEANGNLYLSASRAFDDDACLYKVGLPTNLKENVAVHGLMSLSPNPTRGLFAVSLKNSIAVKDLMLEVFDISGKSVYNQSIKNEGSELYEIIDLSDLQKGVYSIELSGGNFFESGKIILE